MAGYRANFAFLVEFDWIHFLPFCSCLGMESLTAVVLYDCGCLLRLCYDCHHFGWLQSCVVLFSLGTSQCVILFLVFRYEHMVHKYNNWVLRLCGLDFEDHVFGMQSMLKQGWGISLSRDSVEGASGRAPLLENPKDEVFERYAKCPVGGPPSL